MLIQISRMPKALKHQLLPLGFEASFFDMNDELGSWTIIYMPYASEAARTRRITHIYVAGVIRNFGFLWSSYWLGVHRT